MLLCAFIIFISICFNFSFSFIAVLVIIYHICYFNLPRLTVGTKTVSSFHQSNIYILFLFHL